MDQTDDIHSQETSAATAELHYLKRRQHQAYLAINLTAVLLLVVSWLGRGPDDPFITYAYPTFAIAFALVALATSRRPPQESATTGIFSLTLAAVLILGRLAWHYAADGPVEGRLLVLVGGHYWAVGILLVAVLVGLGTRMSLLISGLIYLVATVIALLGISDQLLAGTLSQQAVVYLLRVHLFLFALLILGSIGTALRDRIIAALGQASAFSHMARTDLLSGLDNRRGAHESLQQATAASQAEGQPLSVIIADIDRFKQVNDQYGHARGDTVIRDTAMLLRAETGPTDCVARWGGEEFLIICPERTGDDARALAERMRQAVARHLSDGIRVSATFGVAEHTSNDSLDSLIARADDALYEGKLAGRNRVVVARDDGFAGAATVPPKSQGYAQESCQG